jgi:hypothetical protein
MNLVDAGDTLEVVLGGAVAANQPEFNVDWSDVTASGFTPGHSDGATNNTTTVTMVAAPGASTYRLVRDIQVVNLDTAEVTVTVKFDNSATERELFVGVLSPGDTLHWSQASSWRVVRAVVATVQEGEATDTGRGVIELATAGDMREANNNTLVAVTGRVPYHPGTANAWLKATGDGVTLTVNYNVTSISDTGTGRLGVTIATDFAESVYAILCSLERGVATYAVADVEDNNIRLNSQTKTAFEIESFDHTASTMLVDDPANYYAVCYGYWM